MNKLKGLPSSTKLRWQSSLSDGDRVVIWRSHGICKPLRLRPAHYDHDRQLPIRYHHLEDRQSSSVIPLIAFLSRGLAEDTTRLKVVASPAISSSSDTTDGVPPHRAHDLDNSINRSSVRTLI